MVSTRWKNESSFDCTRRAGEKRTGRKEETGGNVSEFGFKPAAFVACGAPRGALRVDRGEGRGEGRRERGAPAAVSDDQRARVR